MYMYRDVNREMVASVGQHQRPVLILWGSDDLAVPNNPSISRFQSLFSKASFQILPETRHGFLFEKATETVHHIKTFLDTLEATSTSVEKKVVNI